MSFTRFRTRIGRLLLGSEYEAIRYPNSRFSSTSHNENEERIKHILQERFTKAVLIDVADISGGCGAMYEIKVISDEFSGLSKVKQHQLVNEALKNEIQKMHGIRISTSSITK